MFGDDVDTDAMVPGRYMKLGVDEIAKHCLESLDASFSSKVTPGDCVVAGRNFGLGSSREQAPEALKHLGVAALIAESFAGLFYRNAFNLGLPAVVCTEAKRIRAGDLLEVSFEGQVRNLTTGETLSCERIPPHLLQLVRDGGLLAQLEKRLRCNTTSS